MKLEAPALERAIRRRVREEVDRSPALRREHRRNLKVRTRPSRLEKLFYPLFITMLAVGLGVDTRHSSMLLPLLTFASAAAAFHWAHRIRGGLFQSVDLAVLMHLPISNAAYVRFEWARVVRSSLWILLLTAAALSAFVAARGGPVLALAVVMLAATVHWMLLLSAALAMVLYRPGWPLQIVDWLFRGAAFAVLVGRGALAPAFASLGNGWLLLLPTGWIPYAVRSGLLDGATAPLSAIIPAAAAAGLLPWLRGKLMERYVVTEITQRPAPSPESILESTLDREMALRSEYDPDLVESPEMKPVIREELRRAIPNLFEERARTRAFLAGFAWDAMPPLERAFARWLTPRERRIAELLLVSPPRWTKRWIIGLGVLAAGLALLLRPGGGTPWGFLLAISGMLTAWPVFGGSWRGLKLSLSTGQPLPVFAGFPVSVGEVLAVVRKGNLVRWAAWMPAYLVAAGLLALRFEGAFGIAARIALALALAQPWMFILQFNGTMQTWQTRRLFPAFAAMILLVIAWVAGLLLCLVPEPEWGRIAGPFLLLTSLPARAMALAVWRRGAVDWMGSVRT